MNELIIDGKPCDPPPQGYTWKPTDYAYPIKDGTEYAWNPFTRAEHDAILDDLDNNRYPATVALARLLRNVTTTYPA